MYHASDNSLWGSGEFDVNGSVSFIANDVAPGDYYILTSTDIDNDNTVCDYGELCEYYPKWGDNPYYFTVSDSNLSGYEIFLQPRIKYGGVDAASIQNNLNESGELNQTDRNKSQNGANRIIINPLNMIPSPNIVEKGDQTFNSN